MASSGLDSISETEFDDLLDDEVVYLAAVALQNPTDESLKKFEDGFSVQIKSIRLSVQRDNQLVSRLQQEINKLGWISQLYPKWASQIGANIDQIENLPEFSK